MKSKILFVIGTVAALLLSSSTANAAPGSSVGAGQIPVESVWISETFTFNSVSATRTLDVDCPSGEKVISGFGIWVDRNAGSASSELGSAIDSDTWRVSFSYGGSQSLPSTLQAHAVCV